MRTSLIIFGVLLLVLGAVLYVLPSPTAQVVSTTTGDNSVSTRTTYSSLNIPWQAVLTAMAAGVVLFVLGMTLPGPVRVVKAKPTAAHVVERNDRVEKIDADGKKTVTERHEQHMRQ